LSNVVLQHFCLENRPGNRESLTLEDVRLSAANEDQRPVIFADAVREMRLDHVRYPRFAGVTNPVVTLNGSRVHEEGRLGESNR
jgi:hypothetical protein